MKTLKESILSKQVDMEMDIHDAFPNWIHPVVLDELLGPMRLFMEQERKSGRHKQIQSDLLKVADWLHSMKGTTLQTILAHPNGVRNAGLYYYGSTGITGTGREVIISFTTRSAWAARLEPEVERSKWNGGPYLRLEVNVDEVEILFAISK